MICVHVFGKLICVLLCVWVNILKTMLTFPSMHQQYTWLISELGCTSWIENHRYFELDFNAVDESHSRSKQVSTNLMVMYSEMVCGAKTTILSICSPYRAGDEASPYAWKHSTWASACLDRRQHLT